MDEAAYRLKQDLANAAPCVFQGALLARHAECELALRVALAEREVLACPKPTARSNCETLSQLLHERATFPLRLHPGAPMTHATEMRLQCGGLMGLQKLLAATRPDVHRMVLQAQDEYDSLVDLPWARIVGSIVAWQPRRRASPKPP